VLSAKPLKQRAARAEVIHMTQRRGSRCILVALACLLVVALSGCAGGGEGVGASAEASGGVAARLAGQFTGAGSEAELKEFVDRETTDEERKELGEELSEREPSEQEPEPESEQEQ
jgi:hypothetical protein